MVTRERIRQVLIIVGVAVVFGIEGTVAAAYSAHDVLSLPNQPATRAGPAWLTFGAGVGVILALGLIYSFHRLRHSPRGHAGSI